MNTEILFIESVAVLVIGMLLMTLIVQRFDVKLPWQRAAPRPSSARR